MPQNNPSEKPDQSQTPPTQKNLQPDTDEHRFLISQLQEALKTIRRLSESLDDECTQNAVVRAELTKDLGYLKEAIGKIEKILHGNGKSLVDRLVKVETFQKTCEALQEQSESKRGNNIVLWVGIAAAVAAIISAAIQVWV